MTDLVSKTGYNGQSDSVLVTPSRSRHAVGGRATLPTYKPIPESVRRYPDEFWSRVAIDMHDTDACFLWQGSQWSDGYGAFRGVAAHRIAYTLAKGEIPDGQTIDHTCHRRECCNPLHLEAVSLSENIARRGCVVGPKYPARKRTATRYARRKARGVCVQCNTPSAKYRCDRCREAHNAKDKGRKR